MGQLAWQKPEMDQETLDILARCAWDLRYCAKTLFSDVFEAPFSGLHHQIFNVVEKAIHQGARKVAIQAPRGIGKTSIAQLIAEQAILFRKFEFICYVQNSATLVWEH
ncbi:MAG: hypothetical protein ACW99X_17465 [Candidatus Thorarchaeota archaeon]